MNDNPDIFANPKYSREELRAMAREFLHRNASSKVQDSMRCMDLQMRMFMRTSMTPSEQLDLIREMAK